MYVWLFKKWQSFPKWPSHFTFPLAMNVFLRIFTSTRSVFFVLAILVGVPGNLILVWTWISLMTSDIKHLFTYSPAIYIFSLVRWLSKYFARFLLGWLSSCCWIIRVLYIFCILVLYQMYVLQIFPFSCVFWRAKVFILIKSNLYFLLLIVFLFKLYIKNSLSYSSLWRFHPVFSFKSLCMV